jgi:hypothetical protein
MGGFPNRRIDISVKVLQFLIFWTESQGFAPVGADVAANDLKPHIL